MIKTLSLILYCHFVIANECIEAESKQLKSISIFVVLDCMVFFIFFIKSMPVLEHIHCDKFCCISYFITSFVTEKGRFYRHNDPKVSNFANDAENVLLKEQ